MDMTSGTHALVALTLVVEGADKKRETIEVKAAVKPLGDTKH